VSAHPREASAANINMTKRGPNILITGTPGTGKTTTCELVASATGMQHVNVGELVKKEELHNGWDDEFECWVIDEDKVRLWGSHACQLCMQPGESQPAGAPLALQPRGLE
jgi:hypothetical protein